MKKLFSIALVLVMLLCCASALAEEPVTLTYAEVNPVEGTIVGDVALAFKDKLEELSGGSVIIDIQASGVLGSEKTSSGQHAVPATPPTSSASPLSL